MRPAVSGSKLGYKVTTQSHGHDVGIHTLVGDYEEKGTNHGKKFYQKLQKIANHEHVKVFLYYWDARDGPDFSGWWFGDQVGGTQVWALSQTHGPTPPRVGWKVPWDSPKPQPGALIVEPSTGVSALGAAAAPASGGIRPAAAAPAAVANIGARVTEATNRVAAVEETAQAVIAKSKALTPGASQVEITALLGQLVAEQQALSGAQKTLTADIGEARKGGTAALPHLNELTKLSPRLRVVSTGIATETNKLKAWSSKASTAQATAANAAATKEAEAKDTTAFQAGLPETKESVQKAEEALESVIATAGPLVQDPPDDDADILNKAIAEIEAAAVEAQNRINDARSAINMKLQLARKYAPETRKAALGEYSQLQQRLTETQKKLSPYKTFKKEFHVRVQARKSLQEMSDNISTLELEVEKVKMITSSGGDQLGDDEIASTEKVATPAKNSLDAMLKSLETKMRTADGLMKEELTQIKAKCETLKKDLEAAAAVMLKQQQSHQAAQTIQTATEKVDAAEELLKNCADAEMPFLKGIEVLPDEESTKAIAECEAAAGKAQGAASSAQTFLRQKLAEAKKLVAEVASTTGEELASQQSRLESVLKRLDAFKKDTVERKLAALMAEVVEGLNAVEKKVQALAKTAAPLAESQLETTSNEATKEALEQTEAAEKETYAALLEVRKNLASKQKEARTPEVRQAVDKMQTRISTCQQDITKVKSSVASAKRVLKAKELAVDEEDKIQKIEEKLAEYEKKAKPGEEEAALGIETSALDDSEIEEMCSAFTATQKALKESSRQIEAVLAQAPGTTKAALTALVDRCKAGQEKITELMEVTKDQRERVLGEAAVRQGNAKMEEVDKALEAMNQAELPFLKGIEVLALEESKENITASETAAQAVQVALSAARSHIASRNAECKKFGEAASKPALEGLAELTERAQSAAAKLSAFKKDTDVRKKAMLMQEADEKVKKAEEKVKKLTEMSADFADEDGKPKEGKSEAECENLVKEYQESTAALTEATTFLSARAKDSGNSAHADTVKELQEKLKTAQTDMVAVSKIAAVYEQKYTAKQVLAEAAELLQSVETEHKKASEVCAPLVEEGGTEFLVAASLRTLVAALRDYKTSKDLSFEAIFKEFTGGADTLTKERFVSHVATLPAALEREELAFEEARREAMFEAIGGTDLAAFTALFKQQYVVLKEITLTEAMQITDAKTVEKLAVGSELETEANPVSDEGSGMTRIPCKVLDSGNSGFVTITASGGAKFCELVTPFSVFSKKADKAVHELSATLVKVSNWFNTKIKELMSAPKGGPLADARGELATLKSKVASGNEQLSKLRSKLLTGKREYNKKESDEKRAHIVAKEKKEVEDFLAPLQVKFEAVEAAFKALQASVGSVLPLKSEELMAFEKPLTVVEACQEQVAAVESSTKELKASCEASEEALQKQSKNALAESKREVQKMLSRCEGLSRNASSQLNLVRGKCNYIIDHSAVPVASLLRKQAQEKSVDASQLFDQLASGSAALSEDAFCAGLKAQLGANYREEHLKLLCRSIAGSSTSLPKRKFKAFVEQFYVAKKPIAMTENFDLGDGKALRKVEADEVIELLEGPTSDDEIGITRVRGKSLTDGTVGWVTLQGNQGTVFLQEIEKPHYLCEAAIPLESDFKTTGEAIRTVKAGEVIELLEGPKKETYPPGLRVKCKTTTADAATGWLTVQDKAGTKYAEADNRYYNCVSSVAMTDSKDIKDCKVVRKLAVGELFLVDEEPHQVEGAGIFRVKAKAIKDDAEGWVTTKGNAGTVYAEPSGKHYSVLVAAPLTQKFSSADSGEVVKELSVGDAVMVLEGPKEEVYPAETRVKGKALSDGTVGWISLSSSTTPWAPFYKCKTASTMHEALVSESSAVREIEAQEVLEVLEGPCFEGDDLRAKCCAEKDGATGWVTVQEGDAAPRLEPLAA